MTGNMLKSGLTLAAIAAICTAAVAATYQLTRERIAANEQALLEQSLEPALSNVDYDGGLTDSKLIIAPPHGLPGNDDAIRAAYLLSNAMADAATKGQELYHAARKDKESKKQAKAAPAAGADAPKE